MPTSAYIAIGSNVGDRLATIDSALAMLERIDGIEITKRSTIIETDPAPGSNPPDQPRYLNAVIEVQTSLSPQELLAACMEVERRHGRDRTQGERWGPRTLDLDVLLYGELVCAEPGLILPHPRMHQRRFVLQPLSEIAPEHVHPTLGKTVQCLLEELASS